MSLLVVKQALFAKKGEKVREKEAKRENVNYAENADPQMIGNDLH